MTIVDCFKRNLESGKIVCEVDTGKKLGFSELWRNAELLKPHFQENVRDIITVILPNSISYIEYMLAVMDTNNIFSPLPYFVNLRELDTILKYVEPGVIVTDREDIYREFKEKYRFINPLTDSPPTAMVRETIINEDAPAALYYSSGTTGDPKGVLYSHKNMVSLIASVNRGFQFTQNDNHLAFLPFGHTASINYNILPALMAGSNLYISKGFEDLRGNFFEVLARYRITYTEIVPTVLLMLLKLNLDISKLDLDQLRFIGCGSSTLPLTSQKKFISQYGIRVCNLYGLSETGPSHVDYPLEEDWKPGSIGVPLDVNECMIAPDGEILLKGANVFIGYYKNDKLYNNVVKDGWFCTGDIGVERDGKYYFVDRKKDLIIKGGINIVPMEIEEVLYKNEYVHECVVVGKDDPIVGEEVVAVVVLKEQGGNGVNYPRELKQFAKNWLSNYKVPARIYIWDHLPKTHSNKLMRRKVREIVNQSIELNFLIDAVREAGLAAQKAFRSKKYAFLTDFQHEKIVKKSEKELVIEEDILCQEIIIKAISRHDPSAAIYSEESDNLSMLESDSTAIKYLIDPLDGTHNFCFGLPFWGISVAVLDKANVPIAGLIFIPEFDLMVKCDGPGHQTMILSDGQWTETTTAQKQMHEALICYDNQFYKLEPESYRLYETLTKQCFTTRITGSASFDIALIASGKINARIWNSTNSYDIAPGIPIIEGAGGCVTDFDGHGISIFSKEVIMSSDRILAGKIVDVVHNVLAEKEKKLWA